MKRLFLIVALLAATTAMAKEQREAKYFQDETIVIWDNNKAPHSNGLKGEAYESQPYRLVNTTKAVLYVYPPPGQITTACPVAFAGSA